MSFARRYRVRVVETVEGVKKYHWIGSFLNIDDAIDRWNEYQRENRERPFYQNYPPRGRFKVFEDRTKPSKVVKRRKQRREKK